MRIGLLVPLFLLILGGGIIAVKAKQAESPSQARVLSKETIDVSSAEEAMTLLPQKQTVGAVEIEVAPENLVPGLPMIFDLSLNTHSVELDYDLVKIASAKDGKGNLYQAKEWTGEKGGHHLQGKLVFDELSEGAEKVELTISGIDQQTAIFHWNIALEQKERG